MAKSLISIGSTSNDGTGDTLRVGAEKINANFDEIYSTFGNGTTLSSTISTSSYASVAGISTVAQGLSGAPNITAGIVTTSGNLNVVGIVTSSGATIYNTTTLSNVVISGVNTHSGVSNFTTTVNFTGTNNNINQSAGTALLNNVVVSGVTTAGIAATSTLATNSTMSFFLQNNTTLRVAVRGSDGVTRYGTIALA